LPASDAIDAKLTPNRHYGRAQFLGTRMGRVFVRTLYMRHAMGSQPALYLAPQATAGWRQTGIRPAA
jgi:hypothetical protein